MYISIEKKCSRNELNYREREKFQSLFHNNEKTANLLKEFGLKSRTKSDLLQGGTMTTYGKGIAMGGIAIGVSDFGIITRFCNDTNTGNGIDLFSNGVVVQRNKKGNYNIGKIQDIPYLVKIDVIDSEEETGNDLIEIDLIGNIEKSMCMTNKEFTIRIREFGIRIHSNIIEMNIQEKLKM